MNHGEHGEDRATSRQSTSRQVNIEEPLLLPSELLTCRCVDLLTCALVICGSALGLVRSRAPHPCRAAGHRLVRESGGGVSAEVGVIPNHCSGRFPACSLLPTLQAYPQSGKRHVRTAPSWDTPWAALAAETAEEEDDLGGFPMPRTRSQGAATGRTGRSHAGESGDNTTDKHGSTRIRIRKKQVQARSNPRSSAFIRGSEKCRLRFLGRGGTCLSGDSWNNSGLRPRP